MYELLNHESFKSKCLSSTSSIIFLITQRPDLNRSARCLAFQVLFLLAKQDQQIKKECKKKKVKHKLKEFLEQEESELVIEEVKAVEYACQVCIGEKDYFKLFKDTGSKVNVNRSFWSSFKKIRRSPGSDSFIEVVRETTDEQFESGDVRMSPPAKSSSLSPLDSDKVVETSESSGFPKSNSADTRRWERKYTT